VVAQLLWGGVALRHGRGWAWARGKVEGVRLFSAARAEMRALPHGRGSDHVELLEEALRSNERFIYAHSRDLYWRLYFLLTGGAK
jgi:hypothetical protein